jgi:hypothetical protein
MRIRTKLSIEELSQWLSYNPNNGEITWNRPPSSGKGSAKRISGKIAGRLATNGYMTVMICGVNYDWHRLAWALTYGQWPKHTIDHIDKNKRNNRITNLRDVTQELQQRNRADLNINNTTGYAGVRFRKDTNKFSAFVMLNYKHVTIGCYNTAEEASAARKNYILINNLGYEHRAAQ